jgi:hypothetical protein
MAVDVPISRKIPIYLTIEAMNPLYGKHLVLVPKLIIGLSKEKELS